MNVKMKKFAMQAAQIKSTSFIGHTLPCNFANSKALLVLDVIRTHKALQKSYRKNYWMKKKIWEEKHQRADRVNYAN